MKPRKRKRGAKPGEQGRSLRLEKGIAVLLVAVAAGMVIFFLAGESLIHRDRTENGQQPAGKHGKAPPSPMAPAAREVLERFFEAVDTEGKADFVRCPDRVLPLMKNYHEKRGHPFPTLARVSPGEEAAAGGSPAVFFRVEPFSGTRYAVAVMWDGGKFAVDWESLTAYGTMDWAEWVEKKPEAVQVMRVYLEEAGPADRIPGTPEAGRRFRMSHRDGGDTVVAEAGRDASARFPAVEGRKQIPATVEASWHPAVAGRPAFPEIIRVVAQGWSP